MLFCCVTHWFSKLPQLSAIMYCTALTLKNLTNLVRFALNGN